MKNIIFDIGCVLLHQETNFIAYLQNMHLSYEESELICNTIFGEFFTAPLWLEFDRGTVSEKDIVEDAVKKLPQYEEYIRKLLVGWTDTFVPVKDTVEILYQLKEKDYKVYLLSNFSKEGFLRVEKKYDFLRMVDGGVISYQVNSIKPEPIIYQKLLEKYHLVPEESLFIDDRKENVHKMKEFGIDGICFVEDGSLKEKLMQKGIQIEG